jgi:hypothetical protein
MIAHNLEDAGVATVNLPVALKKWKGSEHPAHCAAGYTFFGVDAAKETTWFDWAANDGEGVNKAWRAKRFAAGLASWTNQKSTNLMDLHGGFDWDGLGEATVVDV